MNAALSFFRAHLTARREPLLLTSAPPHVEVKWSARQTANSVIDTLNQVIRLLAEIDDYPPTPAIEAPAVCLAELADWNMPFGFICWLVERLPDAVRLRFAEMINIGRL